MKNHWMKRVLCLLVTLSLCIGSVPAAAAAEEAPAAPAAVWWAEEQPGFLKWNAVEGVDGYRLSFYLDGEKVFEDFTETDPYTNWETYSYSLATQDFPWVSGTYTAEVEAVIFTEEDAFFSDPTLSDSFAYTRPDAQLDTPANLRWEGTNATWDAVEGEDVLYLCTLYVDFYGYWEPFSSVVYNTTYDSSLFYAIEDMIAAGATAFAFDVMAISSDITVIANSEVSERVVYEVEISGGTVTPPDAPAAVWWSETMPGCLEWEPVDGADSYYLEFLKDGEYHADTYAGGGSYSPFMWDLIGDDGTYTASVRAVAYTADGTDMMSEPTETSDAFIYTVPSASLATPANPRWDGELAIWDAVTGENVHYLCSVYVDFGDGNWEYMNGWGDSSTSSNLPAILMEELTQTGVEFAGYAFTVTAISMDPTVCRNSEPSAMVEYEGSGNTGTAVPVTGISMKLGDAREVGLGQQFNPDITIEPSNATNQNFTITSSNPSVAVVEQDAYGDWSIRFVGEGTAAVTATAEDGGFTDTCVFTVSNILPESVTFKNANATENIGDTLSLMVNDTFDLNVSVEPYNTTNNKLKWTVSDESVLSIEEHGDSTHYVTLTALAAGEATVTAVCEADGSVSDSVTLTVTEFGDVSAAPLWGGLWSDHCASGFSGYDPTVSRSTITIWSAEELALLASASREIGKVKYAGYTIKLGCDIHLGGRYWVPGGDALSSVTFDGNGHTIYGLTISSDELEKAGYDTEYLGLFGSDPDLTVKNLHLKDAVIIGEDVECAGVIAGKCGSLTNCKTLHSTIVIKNSNEFGLGEVGGLAGDVSYAMENCRTDFGSMTVENCQAGGLAGQVTTAKMCTNNMDISARDSYVGGLFWNADRDLDQCINEGDITSYASHAAGIVQSFGGDSMQDATMRTCFNKGKITAPGDGDHSSIAGLVGSCNGYGAIIECSNLANLTAETDGSSAAGIVSNLNGKAIRCKSEGTISADSVAGIAYEVYGTAMSCRNNAELDGEQVGGIAYRVYSGGTVDGCENTVAINTDAYAAGGIVYETNGLVSTCVNYGSITAEHAGGIAYRHEGGTIKGCGNYSPVRATGTAASAGGIVSNISSYSSDALRASVTGCENHASVTAPGGYAGGIVGNASVSGSDAGITSCRNSGTVSGARAAGGIVGSAYADNNRTLLIEQCENTGTVQAIGVAYYAGGILGGFTAYTSVPDPLTLMDVHNDAVVKNASSDRSSHLGGIVGAMWLEEAAWPLMNAFSSGSVIKGTENGTAGLLVGLSDHSSSMVYAPSYYRRSGSLSPIGNYNSSTNTPEPVTVGLTAAEMSNASSFETFDFANVWEMAAGRPRLRMSGLSSARESGAGYYTALSDCLFRIVVPGASYPSPAGFTVTCGETVRHSGGGADVSFPLQGDSEAPVVFTKDGYHTYEMPRKLVQNYNVVTMIPDSVKTPFVQSILLKKEYGNGSYSYENLRSGIISVYTTNALDSTEYEGETVYVDVNWNGHEEGSIWLEQNGVRIPLADDGFSTVEMGKNFTAGSTVYVCAGDESGTFYRTPTTIKMVEKMIKLDVELPDMEGVNPHNSGNEKLDILPGEELKLDFDLIKDYLNVTIDIEDDGTVKGMAGVTLGKSEAFEAVYQDLKEGSAIFFDEAFAATEAGKKKIDDLLKNRKVGEAMSKYGIEANCKFYVVFAGHVTDEGKLAYDKTSFLFKAEGDLGYEYQTTRVLFGVAIPTVSYLGVGVESQFGSSMSKREDGLLHMDAEQLEVELKVKGRDGPGINGVLVLQATGDGGIRILDLPGLEADGTQISFISGIGFAGEVFGAEGEWEALEFPEYAFWKNGEFCWEMVDGGTLFPKLVTGSYAPAFVSLLNMESEAEVFKNSVSTTAHPRLAVLEDGTRVLAWLDYEDTRGGADGCAVYYSICKNDTWSAPVLLDNDGTADTSLVMEELNGTVYLAWMDRDRSYGDTYPETAEGEYDFLSDLLTADISVAHFDAEEGAFTDITTFGASDAMDSQPVLAAAEGGVALGWRSADAACLSDLAENGFGAFRFAVYQKDEESGDYKWSQVWTREEEPAWYTEDELPADAESIYSYLGDGYAYAAQGGLQTAVFPVRNEETGTYSLCGSFHDGTGWGEPILLTDLDPNTVITALSADFDPDGMLNIAMTSRGLNADGTRSDEAELLTLACDPENDVALTEADYDRETLVPGGMLELELSVRNLGPRQANTFLVTVLDGSEPLTQETVYEPVASGAVKDLIVSCPLPSAEEWGNLSALTVTVDPINWEDADESSNTLECPLYRTDVSIEKVYATEDVNDQTGERTTTVSAWVVNRGREPLSGVTLTLYGNLDRETALATVSVPKTIAAGCAELCTMTTDALTAGNYALVEASVESEENITSNNSDFGIVLAPKRAGELKISLFDVKRNSKGNVTATLTAENTGETVLDTTLIAAAYQNGRMMSAEAFHAISVDGGTSVSKTVDLGKHSGSVELRLYTLSADGSYTPAGAVITHTLN